MTEPKKSIVAVPAQRSRECDMPQNRAFRRNATHMAARLEDRANQQEGTP